MDHILLKMKMFCFSDHTWMHLHPTGLGPMGAAANGRYGALPAVDVDCAGLPEHCRQSGNFYVTIPQLPQSRGKSRPSAAVSGFGIFDEAIW
jgi:hypothetical protein